MLETTDGPETKDAIHGGEMDFEIDRLGIIEQTLEVIQGHGVMELELIQNADDANASRLVFDARDDALLVTNDAAFTGCSLARRECDWQQAGGPDGKRQRNFHAI